MIFKKIMVFTCSLFLAVSVIADAEKFPAKKAVSKYADKAFGGETGFVVKRATLPKKLVVGIAYTEGYLDSKPGPLTNYSTGRAGVITIFDASNDDGLTLVEASQVFRLPQKNNGGLGTLPHEVVISKPDRFTILMSCIQCDDVQIWREISVRFHFAFRLGQWVVSGIDRKTNQTVGASPINPQTQQRSLIDGVVEHVSHNYITGKRIVKTYKFDEEKIRMKLVSEVSTQGNPLYIPLHDFNPASEIPGPTTISD